MSKKIDGKKFKAAVKALNEVLEADELDKIKVVGVKKEEVIEAFTTNVQSYIDKDKVSDLPDAVIDFYNDFIADDDSDDADDSDDDKDEGKKGKGKKGKGKKGKGKEKKEKKAPKEKKVKTPGKAFFQIHLI